MNNTLDLIITLKSLTGSKEKSKFIEENANNENFKKFLYYALNPQITFNLSEKTLYESFYIGVDEKSIFKDIFDCCEQLSKLNGITYNLIHQVQLLLYEYDDKDRDLYIKLLSKTLRLGVTAKTVNKIIPGLIPEWEVQQAFSIEKYPIKEGTHFWLTEKLNGVRATYYKGKLYARSGVPYKNVSHITNILDDISKEHNVVFDGEITLINKWYNMSDNDAFRKATGIINSDVEDKTELGYTIFDIIPADVFESTKEPDVWNYSHRRKLLESLSSRLNTQFTKVLPVLYEGDDQNVISTLLDKMVNEDKEGLMLNTDCPYYKKRHRGILKIKRFYTMDLPIIDVEEGTGKLKGTLGTFVLEYKSNIVRVGSGFTDEERDKFWKDREHIISNNYLCEVKYKEISTDKKTGLESLQFPVFVTLRTDKDIISYD